jgi:hypothetical protein
LNALIRDIRVFLAVVGIAWLGLVWAVPWHSISPPGAVIMILVAGLLLFFGLRRR